MLLAGVLWAQSTEMSDQDAARILNDSAFTQKAKTSIQQPSMMSGSGADMGGMSSDRGAGPESPKIPSRRGERAGW